MRRHPSLAPLSRDHHRALVAARNARRAARADAKERVEAGRAFAAFFDEHAVPHFRAEEEDLFPLIAPGPGEDPQGPLARALLDHVRLHAVAAEIAGSAADESVPAEQLAAAGALLEEHVRLEERVLFPLIEERVPEERLAALRLDAPGSAPVAVDLRPVDGRGAVWSASSDDLNVNLVAWPADEGVETHVNGERDVVMTILAGRGEVVVDGAPHAVEAGWAVLVPKGAERAVRAGAGGIRYVTAHVRRPPHITLGR